jgi:hypothetical protein
MSAAAFCKKWMSKLVDWELATKVPGFNDYHRRVCNLIEAKQYRDAQALIRSYTAKNRKIHR